LVRSQSLFGGNNFSDEREKFSSVNGKVHLA
jgi:hypothetical protein